MANKYAVETAFNLIDKATEPLNKIGVKGNAVGKKLKTDFLKAQDQIDGIGKTVKKVGVEIGKAAVKAGAAVIAATTAAATAFVVKGVKDAVVFEKSMERIGVQANLTKEQVKTFSNELINLSNATGSSLSGLADAQLEAISKGVDVADSVKFVEIATKAAQGGFTDTSTVINSLTSVLKSYDLEAKDASKITDQMMAAAKAGGVSFSDMATKLEHVIPVAAKFGVSSEELFASISTLTSQGVPIADAAKKIKSALEKDGRAGIFNVASGEKFNDMLNQITNSTGSTEQAFERMDRTTEEQWGSVLNKIQNTGVRLGTLLLPVFQKIIDKLSIFVDKFANMDFGPFVAQVESVIDRVFNSLDFDALAAGIGTMFNVLYKVIEKIIQFVSFAWKMRVPIIAVIAAVNLYKMGMLAAAFVVNGFTAAQNIAKGVQLAAAIITGNQTKAMALYKTGTMGATIQTTAFWIRQKAAQGLNFAGTIIKQGAAFVAMKAQLIASTAATIAHAVAQKAVALASNIAAAAQWALNAAMTANPIGLIIAAIVALIAIVIICVKNWDKIVAALKTAWEWIKNVASIIWDGLCNAFKSLVGFVKENSEKVLAFIAIFTGPFGFIISIIKELKDNWSAIVEAFQTDGIIAGFKKLGGVILSAVLAPIQGLLETLAHIPGVGKLLGPAVDKIKNFREELKGIETETTIVQNVVPGAINSTAAATKTASAGVPASQDRRNQTITAAAVPPTRPMTTAEQYSYSQTTNREQVDIGVRAEPGTSARVTRQPRSPNVSLAVSGGN